MNRMFEDFFQDMQVREVVVMRYDGDKVVVQFDSEGEKSMVTKVVLDNRLMDVA